MTERQKDILKAIVEEYAEVASPVGSITLAKLFGVSSATIRSEMARLEEIGYIEQPHTSAGRIPTDKGYRFYVNGVSDDDQQKLPQTARATQVMDARITGAGEPSQTIRSAVDSLAEITHNLGLATIGSQLYLSGLSRLFMQPEFGEIDSVQGIANLLDNLEPWLREAAPHEALSVYIGRENPIGKNAGASLIISRFSSPYSDHSYIGVLGPTRQSYARVMRLVQHTGELLETLL